MWKAPVDGSVAVASAPVVVVLLLLATDGKRRQMFIKASPVAERTCALLSVTSAERIGNKRPSIRSSALEPSFYSCARATYTRARTEAISRRGQRPRGVRAVASSTYITEILGEFRELVDKCLTNDGFAVLL